MPIHELVFTTLQGQPGCVVTATVLVALPNPWMRLPGEIEKVHTGGGLVVPPCVTVKIWSANRMLPLRLDAVELVATTYSKLPVPIPFVPDGVVIHVLVLI